MKLGHPYLFIHSSWKNLSFAELGNKTGRRLIPLVSCTNNDILWPVFSTLAFSIDVKACQRIDSVKFLKSLAFGTFSCWVAFEVITSIKENDGRLVSSTGFNSTEIVNERAAVQSDSYSFHFYSLKKMEFIFVNLAQKVTAIFHQRTESDLQR